MEVGRIPVRSLRCYRFGQEQLKGSLGILGLFAFHKYVWDAGYTVTHLKWSLSLYVSSKFVSFGASELMESKQATAQIEAKVFRFRWICRLVMMCYWGGLSFSHAFLLPFYESLGMLLSNIASGILVNMGKAALFGKGEEIEWAWEAGIPAYLAGFEHPYVERTLPINEKAFLSPAPQLDIFHPKVGDSETAYLNQQIGNDASYKKWKKGAIAYWDKVIDVTSDGADLREARKKKVKSSIDRIQTDEELRGLFIRLADESLNPERTLERRQTIVAGVFIALDDCPTAWVAIFERLYRDVMSEGKGVEWKVQDGNSQLKEAVVVGFGSFLKVSDQQHYLVGWRRAFGAETGMANPLAVRSESNWGPNEFFNALMQGAVTSPHFKKENKHWITLFRERYTPERMVAHWRDRLNSGREGGFVQEVNRFIADTVGISQTEWDEKGLYDTTRGHFTDKGICLILAAVGELTPDDEIGRLAPDYFAQLVSQTAQSGS